MLKRIAAVLLVCVAIASLLALSSCKPSDTIRRVLYSQDAEVVDEEATPLVTLKPPDENAANENLSTDYTSQEQEQAQEDVQTLLAAEDGDVEAGAALLANYEASAQDNGAAASNTKAGSSSNSNAAKNSNTETGSSSNTNSAKNSNTGTASNKENADAEDTNTTNDEGTSTTKDEGTTGNNNKNTGSPSGNASNKGNDSASSADNSNDENVFNDMYNDSEDEVEAEGGSGGDDSSPGSGSSDAGSTDGEQSGTGTGEDEASEGNSMDSEGEYESLPTNIGHVATYGEYAATLCMIAGADKLCASSEEFTSNCSAISAWSDAASVSAVFSEYGDLLPDGATKLIELHEAGNCDAVIVTNESQLGDDLSTLKDAGINVITANFSSLSNIQSTVRALGKLLSEETGNASVEVADQYERYCSDLLSSCSGQANCYTAFISDWDSDASWQVTSGYTTLAEGTGAAATKTGTASIITDCLSKVGVTNIPGTDTYKGMASGKYWLSQFSKNVGTYTVTGSSGYESVAYSNRSANPTRIFTIVDPSNPDGILLGKNGFKSLIAEDTTVAERLMYSRDNGGFYAPCDTLPVRISAREGVGLYADDSHYALSYIGDGQSKGADCYTVYTIPHGLYSSWSSGSIESILLVAWADQKYNGSDNLQTATMNFYRDFYGIDLTPDQYSSITKDAGE